MGAALERVIAKIDAYTDDSLDSVQETPALPSAESFIRESFDNSYYSISRRTLDVLKSIKAKNTRHYRQSCKKIMHDVLHASSSYLAKGNMAHHNEPYLAQSLEHVLHALQTEGEDYFDIKNVLYIKDLAVASLKIKPAGPLIIERSGIPRKIATSGGMRQFFSFLKMTMMQRSLSPYYEIHHYTPLTEHFTEQGWHDAYRIIARMLHETPDCLGLLGGSWFYDPEVARISPHLGYLRDFPALHGAKFYRGWHSEDSTHCATLTSKKRKSLYAKGEYNPISYVMIWQRDAILTWYRKTYGSFAPQAVCDRQ